ncbi:Crp/Fnr family transcriptional regulator [Clostridium celatum]|uniref:Cyclic nucleotide-binding domain protein n=1 Tax=Clostridium celatum DSM 1785 TaxID=545697 RepID=L1QMF5_9CLOT|nr:cyclic nucleotide-binding domain-containing protein [Clostridium celatum]EKY28747.1 cyclic nucleotide-binding domain protein [Clostridium celatum DSM 1785]MCE9655315.1 Crp/Fnr family transcriptional regulator [Clostridium celatum]MDU2265647.1 Crp/Fnr family transcriptional regulator [Clostridium celatum]MDU6295503.1 Crp/Fnr family transcriptional regulator [Clostridium celatum]MDY3361098.1 Crp/Fnr family transcriptional regulator [Clostridium celatum]
MEIIINQLQKNELFKGLSAEKIENVINKIKYSIKRYSKNEIIANEDDVCTTLSLVLDGSVEIQRLYSNGKYIVLKRLSTGDVFGEALVFSKAKTYPATVMSLSESSIFFIDKEDVLKLCSTEEKILENFISLLSDKVFILNSKIKSISFKSIRQRVINFILDEVREQKNKNIILKNTKEEIAASLGIPRPSLSRELIYLRDNGYINFSRRSISVIDIESLEEELFN